MRSYAEHFDRRLKGEMNKILRAEIEIIFFIAGIEVHSSLVVSGCFHVAPSLFLNGCQQAIELGRGLTS